MRKEFMFVACASFSMMSAGVLAETKAKTTKPTPAVAQPVEKAAPQTAKVQPEEAVPVPVPQGQKVPQAQPLEEDEMNYDPMQDEDDDASYQLEDEN